MTRRSRILILGLFACLLCACGWNSPSTSVPSRVVPIKGLGFVAPPQPFKANPMLAVQHIGSNSIAVHPYAYTRPGTSEVHYNEGDYQWWGERPEGVKETIRLAKAAGLSVMLKPMVYFPGSWPGDHALSSTSAWEDWEADYTGYVLFFATMADTMKVESFCVGTEFRESVRQRPQFWRQLIQDIRQVYKGQLTYAANWDDYQEVPFWDALDVVGIDAYFPLSDQKTPTSASLKKVWQPIVQSMSAWQKKTQRPIIFTEFGYMSVDGCADKVWEIEASLDTRAVNEKAQSIALQVLWEVFSTQPWWQGGYLWKWFPEMQGHEGYPHKDYTPQGKSGATVLGALFRAGV